MRRIKVYIEGAEGEGFSAYMPDEEIESLNFGVIGTGETIPSTIEDFKCAYEDVKQAMIAEGAKIEDVEFDFSLETSTFLSFAKNKVTLSFLESITGVAKGQLSHYVTGVRTPSKKTSEKIQKGINEFGKMLQHLQLA